MYTLGFVVGLAGAGLSENGLPILGGLVTVLGLAFAVTLVTVAVLSARRDNAEADRAIRERFKLVH